VAFFIIWRPSSESTAPAILAFSTTEEKDSLQLEDGSIVWLNKNSMILYPASFTGGERKVKLEGEAFFQVAGDKRPFSVEANNTLTTVLGTTFNINSTTEPISITVLSGKVAFSATQNKVFLGKGEQAESANGIVLKLSMTDPNSLAWKTGVLVFENKSLSEVVKTLEAYYNQTISLSPQIAKLSLTASFHNQALEEALKVIGITLNINVKETENGFTLIP
jgi:transmembrane sensor